MATFDETARQASKVNGVGLIPWLDGFAQESMAADFAAWDDTRRASWPGGPERTDDVVCVLRRRADGGTAHMIVEVETEPRADCLARLGVYELLLAIEVRALGESGPPIYGVVIHLTGSRNRGPLLLTQSATHPGILVEPIEIWLADQSADDHLTRLESKELDLCNVTWVVLMRGGGEPKNIERWKRLVERELDPEKRANYRAFALTFAELIPELVNWQQHLEGWLMRESQYLKSFEDKGEARGEVRGRRTSLLQSLQERLQAPPPESIRLAIEGTNDLHLLEVWFKAAVTTVSWEEFEKLLKRT